MTIAVTGATGHLGRLVVEALLDRGVPAQEIVATGRQVSRIQDLAEAGVVVRRADYDEPESLDAAFAGVDRLLLVSGLVPGVRVRQHFDAIEAAARAGVSLLAYTSIPKAETSSIGLAADHRATEAILAGSGVPHALLRNCWYLENYTGQVPTVLATAVVLGCAGNGLLSAAPRAEFAEAAATVLTEGDHAGKVYELGADEPFTLADFAAAVREASGVPVEYVNLPEKDLTAALVQVGLDEGYAAALANADLGIERGDLHVVSGDLRRLLGRPTVRMVDAVAEAVAAATAPRVG